MPILEVEIVVGPEEELAPGLAGRLADAAAAVFAIPPGRTWVRLRALPCDRYAEDGGGPPAGVRPVFVSILKARRPRRRSWPRKPPDWRRRWRRSAAGPWKTSTCSTRRTRSGGSHSAVRSSPEGPATPRPPVAPLAAAPETAPAPATGAEV